MKYLLPLILACALLCGCGHTLIPEEPVSPLPTESVAGEITEPEEYGGTVQTVPLNLRKVRGLCVFNGKLLLFSGQGCTTLTLLDQETLEECASLTLDFQLEQDDPSLVLHPAGSLSFFDPDARETVLLDSTLQEVRRIPIPGALSGSPILSEDGKTLFYCTASHVRAWDLETGIRRCVKEMSFEFQTLTGVLMDGSVLQCQITEGTQVQTLYFSGTDGRLLHQLEGQCTVETSGSQYFASIPAGTYRTFLFGSDPEAPRMLFPDEAFAEVFSLPGQMAALTAFSLEDNQVQLDYYDLVSGLRTQQLVLGAYQFPRSAECVDEDTLVLLTFDPAEDRDLLILWDLCAGSSPEADAGTRYVSPYFPAESPDTAGLAQCRQQAARLGNLYGIRILFGEDAPVAKSQEHTMEPEHLVPILQRELSLLEQRLTAYPPELLKDTAAHFSSLNLCLVRSLSGAAGDPEASAGVHFLDGTDAYVIIETGAFGEQALYHQLFHLMETHIFSKSKAFDRWDTLNPAGFRYDYDYNANARRDSGVYLFEENRAFVDTYAMSYPKEDRARIMEYAMLPGNAELFRPKSMQAKLRQLCTGIREAYGLKNDAAEFLWEQYLE